MASMASIPRYFTSEQVQNVLTWPLVNEAVEESMKAIVHPVPGATEGGNTNNQQQSYADQPARNRTLCGQPSRILFAMPGFVGNYELTERVEQNKRTPTSSTVAVKKFNTLACKMVTSFPTNAERQPPLPNILANILLFNTETGLLECIMDGTEITAWRTAAASIVATKYLYFHRFAAYGSDERQIKVAIIGCGVQGQSHARGICATFPVSEIFLWNRTTSKANALAVKLRTEAPKTRVHVAESAAAAVAEADVICVSTYSATALINFAMLKKRSIHINTVGAGQVHFGEVAQDIYDHANVYVDSWASARIELKDLKAQIIAEVGEVITNEKYPKEEGITIFQSMGMAVEDATVGQAAYEVLKN